MEHKTKTKFTVDRDALEVRMERVFDAPRELVYRVVTDPNLVGQWWGPGYLTTEVESYEVEPGGAWRFIQRDPDGSEYAFRGTFREVIPPERLVYTFIYEGTPDHEIIETITLQEIDGKTLMTAFDRFASAEALDGMVSSGMESGAVESWDRLARLVEKQ